MARGVRSPPAPADAPPQPVPLPLCRALLTELQAPPGLARRARSGARLCGRHDACPHPRRGAAQHLTRRRVRHSDDAPDGEPARRARVCAHQGQLLRAHPWLEEGPRGRAGGLHEAFDGALAAPTLARAAWRRGTGAALPTTHPLEAGEIILHPAVRPLGWSENLTLSTLVRNTHPLHFDAQRYGRDGLVVCGGFVQAMAQALASLSFARSPRSMWCTLSTARP